MLLVHVDMQVIFEELLVEVVVDDLDKLLLLGHLGVQVIVEELGNHDDVLSDEGERPTRLSFRPGQKEIVKII